MDNLCHEYGWSIEHVFNCTKAQVDVLCGSIGKRKEAEAEFQAAIHGADTKKTTTNKKLDAGRDFDKLKSIGIPIVEE